MDHEETSALGGRLSFVFVTSLTACPDQLARRIDELNGRTKSDEAIRVRSPHCSVHVSDLRAGRSSAGCSGPALQHGVLLQIAMGASARVPRPLPKKPLSVAEKGHRERPHAIGKDRDSGQPYDRRRTMGLPRHYQIQKFDRGHYIES